MAMLGLSLWGVYAGEGYVIHFGVGDENMTKNACRSVLQLMAPKSKGDLKKTRISRQHIPDIRVRGTRIRVNNNKHNWTASPQEMIWHRCKTFLHQEFKYNLVNFNSERFATFVRYGYAIPFKNQNEAHSDTTQTLQMIMQQRMEAQT
ncbi:LOW QUALITY PROTEIN: phospholipase A and acyltransferase 4-like [Anableps anableps]